MPYLRPFIIGAIFHLPGSFNLGSLRDRGAAGDALYCYGVWMKHLVMLWKNGMRSLPDTVAELGPGTSLGVGLAALLSGADRYYALDAIRWTDTERNLATLDQLIGLLQRRAPRPVKGNPDFDDQLDEHLFPSHILTDEVLEAAMRPERLRAIRSALVGDSPAESGDIVLEYMVPWSDPKVVREGSVDVVLSQGVLQSLEDPAGTYKALATWLKPGGMMSHQIDLTAMTTSRVWNGHRTYGERTWRFIVGRRPFLFPNREPHSTHLGLLERNQFEIVCDLKQYRFDGVDRSKLAPRWRSITDDDLTCSGTFIQARKASS